MEAVGKLQDMPDVLQAKQIKELLGISLAGVYELLNRADFPAIRVTEKRMIVPKSAFIDWLNEQATKGA